MDSLKLLIYILARIGLMLLLCVFGAFVGVILFPSLCNLMPGSWMSIKNVLIDQSWESIIAFAICTAVMVRVFYNDGKIHAAYEEWSSITITTVLLLMIFFYFIPAIFYSSFSSEGKGEVFYLVLYYPSVWLREHFGLEYSVSVLVGMGVSLVLCFIAYITSFRLYVKKHPVILRRMQEPDEPEADDEEEDDDPDPWDE